MSQYHIRVVVQEGTFGLLSELAGRTLTAGDGLTGGGNLTADRRFDVGAPADGSILVFADYIQVGVLATDAQHGVRGGGTQHAVATPTEDGFESAADKTKLDGLPSSVPPTTRVLEAGAGLTGGGDLSADRTFNVGADADGSIAVGADSIKVGVLATDAQHGARGRGTQHTTATQLEDGFMSKEDKTKLDTFAATAKGVATMNFGNGNGATDKEISSVTVTGQTLLPADAIVRATLRLEATADHPIDEVLAENIGFLVGDIVAGVGFTIYGQPPEGSAYGDFKVDWSWA